MSTHQLTGSTTALVALAVLASLVPAARAVNLPAAEQRARQALADSAGVTVAVTVDFRTAAKSEPRSPVDMHTLADQCAYYDRLHRVVVVDVNACRQKLFAPMQDLAECCDAAFVLILHELIHAYQDDQINRHQSPLPADRWLRFLCEGHAVEFSRQIAAEHGVSALTLAKFYQAPAAAPQANLAERRANLLFDFNYVLSARYVARQCRTLNGFAELLDQELNYATVLALAQSPDQPSLVSPLPGPRHLGDPATQPSTAALKNLVPGPLGNWTLAAPLELDYLDALVYVAPADFVDPQIAASFVCGTLVSATGTDGAVLETCVLRLRDDASAHTLWQHACTQHHAWAGEIDNASHVASLSTRDDDTDCCRNWPAPDRTLTLIRRGDYLVVANSSDPETASRFVDQLLQNVFSAEPTP